ncbi:hypothetical protein MMC17_005196 [Xylographa soralifera]|nr:hypothetical protein [Xylographa soralifera]
MADWFPANSSECLDFVCLHPHPVPSPTIQVRFDIESDSYIEVTALCDTGAEVNIIAFELIRQYGLPVNSDPGVFSISGMDGQSFESLGYLELPLVPQSSADARTMPFIFYVLKRTYYALILGSKACSSLGIVKFDDGMKHLNVGSLYTNALWLRPKREVKDLKSAQTRESEWRQHSNSSRDTVMKTLNQSPVTQQQQCPGVSAASSKVDRVSSGGSIRSNTPSSSITSLSTSFKALQQCSTDVNCIPSFLTDVFWTWDPVQQDYNCSESCRNEFCRMSNLHRFWKEEVEIKLKLHNYQEYDPASWQPLYPWDNSV